MTTAAPPETGAASQVPTPQDVPAPAAVSMANAPQTAAAAPPTAPAPPKAQASAPAGWSTHEGTLVRPLSFTGRGLHTGRKVTVRILPVPPGEAPQGIVFRRTDSGRTPAELPVSPDLWRKLPLCSTLQTPDGIRVRTVEHFLAALLMCEIDHAVVELDAEELPHLDGSAKELVAAIKACGRTALPEAKRFIRILRPFAARFDNGSRYRIVPAPDYIVNATTKTRGFTRMRWNGVITPRSFAEQVAPARSYGHLKFAVPALIGGFLTGTPLLRGARPGSVAAIFKGRVLGGMTIPDEFVRHRILDLLGDFALAGAPLIGRVDAGSPTHEYNHECIRRLLAARDAWEWATFSPASA